MCIVPVCVREHPPILDIALVGLPPLVSARGPVRGAATERRTSWAQARSTAYRAVARLGERRTNMRDGGASGMTATAGGPELALKSGATKAYWVHFTATLDPDG